MENRDRDKLIEDESSNSGSKTDSESNFGKDIGRSEDWDSEPSRNDKSSSGDSGWQGDSGRSSGGSRSNLGEQEDVSPSRSGGSFDVEH